MKSQFYFEENKERRGKISTSNILKLFFPNFQSLFVFFLYEVVCCVIDYTDHTVYWYDGWFPPRDV